MDEEIITLTFIFRTYLSPRDVLRSKLHRDFSEQVQGLIHSVAISSTGREVRTSVQRFWYGCKVSLLSG